MVWFGMVVWYGMCAYVFSCNFRVLKIESKRRSVKSRKRSSQKKFVYILGIFYNLLTSYNALIFSSSGNIWNFYRFLHDMYQKTSMFINLVVVFNYSIETITNECNIYPYFIAF